jgi:hypothetical protein
MNNTPTLHVTLQAKGIVAKNYDDAKGICWDLLLKTPNMPDTLNRMNIYNIHQFWDMARVAKECDGTYTVTVP